MLNIEVRARARARARAAWPSYQIEDAVHPFGVRPRSCRFQTKREDRREWPPSEYAERQQSGTPAAPRVFAMRRTAGFHPFLLVRTT